MAWVTWLRGAGLAAVLVALLWATAAQAQERPVLALVEAGSERLVVGWTWDGGDDPAAFSVHWRRRVSGAGWESAQAEGAARRFEVTGLRPSSAYIVRVRALDAEGRGIRAPGGGRPFDLRGVFDTIQLPVPDPPRVVFDGERATASWDAVEGATGYELAWGLTGETAATERLGADMLEFATGALTAGSRYEFRLRSLHQRDRSAPSAVAALTTAAWPHAAPRARFEFHRAAGMLVEWDAVAGAEDYVVAWQKEGDASRAGETAATGTSVLATREGGFFTGTWLFRVRAADAGLWSETTRVWVDSPAPELRFSLESSRELCTEGTLTEIRWRGGGGAGNLWPHVNGRMIGENTYRIKVNCGLIPRTADGEIDESQRDAVITGFLRDGRGTIKSASIRVPRAEALPAPEIFHLISGRRGAGMAWREVPGAGTEQHFGHYLIRWRTVPDGVWTYAEDRDERHSWATDPGYSWGEPFGPNLEEDIAYEVVIAALREAIERETPDALNWSNPRPLVTVSEVENLTATSTHDSITVSWDVPTTDRAYVITAAHSRGSALKTIWPTAAERQSVTIEGLPFDTSYNVTVADWTMEERIVASLRIRTKPAPLGAVPLPIGPKNLQATSTHNSITATWDLPHPAALSEFRVSLNYAGTSQRAIYPYIIQNSTSHTISDLLPDTLYDLEIRHQGVVLKAATIQVRTKALPSDTIGGQQDASATEDVRPPMPNLRSIGAMDWPFEYDARWWITSDPWVWRNCPVHGRLISDCV